MRSFVVWCSFSVVAVSVLGCSGSDGAGLVGDDPTASPGSGGASQELVEKPKAKDDGNLPTPKPPDLPAPAPPATDGGASPPPAPQTYYRLSIGGTSYDPIATPDARKGSRWGDLEVHALIAKAQGISPEETVDVQFPKDKIGSFACDADHRVVWVRPEANKISPRVYATKADSGCRVEVTRIDPVGGWVEGSAQGMLVYSPIIGQSDQKPVAVVFRVQRTQ